MLRRFSKPSASSGGNVRRIPAIFLANLLALPLAAQEQPQDKEGEVKATVEVVILELDVLAVDRKERPVLDLEVKDLEIKVDGKVQAIEFFEPPAVPLKKNRTAEAYDSLLHPADTTADVSGVPRAKQHVVFYIDIEGLPREAIKSTAEAIRTWISSAQGSPRVSIIRYFGGASYLVKDEVAISRIEDELSRLQEREVGTDTSVSGATTGSPYRGEGPTRNWEARRRREEDIVRQILFEESGGVRNGVGQRDLARYLGAERERLKEEMNELRRSCESIATFEGQRYVVLLSEGFERYPGQNLMNFLKRARQSQKSGAGIPPALGGSDITLNGPTGPLFEADELAKWLASTGVRLTFVDPSVGIDFPSADKSSFATSRDVLGDRRNLQDPPSHFVAATGGLLRGLQTGISDTILASLVDTGRAVYRIGVRLQNVNVGKPYSVKVNIKRKGVTALAQSTFVPPSTKPTIAAKEIAKADAALADARRDARAARAERLVGPPIGVTMTWRGKVRVNEKKAGENIYRVEVVVPYGDLKLTPAEDVMVANVRIAVEANGTGNTSGHDEFTAEETPSLTPSEVSKPPQPGFVRAVLLSLKPGKYQVSAAVNDLAEERAGLARLDVVAEK